MAEVDHGSDTTRATTTQSAFRSRRGRLRRRASSGLDNMTWAQFMLGISAAWPASPGEQGAYHGSAMPDFAIVENARKLGASPGRALCVEGFPAASAMDDRRRLRRRARRAVANRHTQPTRLAQIEWYEALPQQPDLSGRDAKAQRQCTAERARRIGAGCRSQYPRQRDHRDRHFQTGARH